MTLRISVVIPSFNQGRFLGESIESVMAQGWSDVELIVIDGGSTDATKEVIEGHAKDLTKWVREPDRGQGHAVNKGLDTCTGDLVAFIGADDVYLPGAFADAVRLFEQNPGCGAVVGGFLRIDNQTRVISEPVPAEYPWPGPVDLMVAKPGSWRLHQVSTFYSRRVLDVVGRFVDEHLRYALDRELLNRVCRQSRVVTSARVYAAYRHHESSKSTSEILRFSRELADLHVRDIPPAEPARLRRNRRALARRQRGSGYLKLASVDGAGWRSARALATVPFVSPRLVLTRTYAVRWLEALGVASPIRHLLGRSDTPRCDLRPLSEVVHEL